MSFCYLVDHYPSCVEQWFVPGGHPILLIMWEQIRWLSLKSSLQCSEIPSREKGEDCPNDRLGGKTCLNRFQIQQENVFAFPWPKVASADRTLDNSGILGSCDHILGATNRMMWAILQALCSIRYSFRMIPCCCYTSWVNDALLPSIS